MADKAVTKAIKIMLNALGNTTTTPGSTSTSESATNSRRSSPAVLKRVTRSNQQTEEQLEQEKDNPTFENEEIKRLRNIIEQKKAAQKHINDKAAAASTSTGKRKTIAPKTERNTKEKPIMTEEMKRLKQKIEEKKANKMPRRNAKTDIPSMKSTDQTIGNTRTEATSSNAENLTGRKRRLSTTTVELKCPICTYSVAQAANFVKHLQDNHGIEQTDSVEEGVFFQECVFCGIMVEIKSYNYHIQIIHPDMFNKKLKL